MDQTAITQQTTEQLDALPEPALKWTDILDSFSEMTRLTRTINHYRKLTNREAISSDELLAILQRLCAGEFEYLSGLEEVLQISYPEDRDKLHTRIFLNLLSLAMKNKYLERITRIQIFASYGEV